MKKRLWVVLGIIVIVLITLGIIGVIFLISLGVRPAVDVSPGAVPSPLAPSFEIRSPLTAEKRTAQETLAAPDRLVIKTGTINLVVKDIKSSLEKVKQYVQEKGGWVVSSSLTEREKIPSGSMTVRVPAEVFDEAIVFFRELAEKVTQESIRGQDVTEEYIDLQSRLRNLEAAENQLLKIMERSGKVSEILEVQRELTNVRSQIEQTKGRIQYLEQSGKFATLTLNLALSEELLPIPPAEKWRPKYVFWRAWRSLLITLKTISYFLIWSAVYLIILIPLAVIIWQVRKFLKKKKEAKI